MEKCVSQSGFQNLFFQNGSHFYTFLPFVPFFTKTRYQYFLHVRPIKAHYHYTVNLCHAVKNLLFFRGISYIFCNTFLLIAHKIHPFIIEGSRSVWKLETWGNKMEKWTISGLIQNNILQHTNYYIQKLVFPYRKSCPDAV